MSANVEDLMVLREHARRSGVSLSTVLRNAVTAEADRLRQAHRPRLGLGRSGGGSIAALLDKHADAPFDAHPYKP